MPVGYAKALGDIDLLDQKPPVLPVLQDEAGQPRLQRIAEGLDQLQRLDALLPDDVCGKQPNALVGTGLDIGKFWEMVEENLRRLP